MSEIDVVIEKSGLKNDKRDNIKILEPTAGIGNFVEQLLKLENKYNFMIDCNEYNNAFFQIGETMYEDIDNVKWYNGDFWIFQNKYNYDYILGNPPFNLAHQVKVKIEYKAEKGQQTPEPKYEIQDKRLYDIHFVSKAYNMLNNGGKLSMIISDRFLRSKEGVFSIFNLYLEDLKKADPSSVDIVKTGEFKQDTTNVAKEMTTNFGMVCITLKKLENFNIDLENKRRIGNIANKLNDNDKKVKDKLKDLGIDNKAIPTKKRKVDLNKETQKLEKEFEEIINKPIKSKSPIEEFKELQNKPLDMVVNVPTNGDKIIKLMRKMAKEKNIKLQIPISISSSSEKLDKELTKFLKIMKISREDFFKLLNENPKEKPKEKKVKNNPLDELTRLQRSHKYQADNNIIF